MVGATHKYASLEMRIVAAILDAIVLASFFLLFIAGGFMLLLSTSDFGKGDPPNWAFVSFLAIVLGTYPVFSALYFIVLWTWRGQTVGQMAMHIAVVARDGYRIGWGSSVLRYIGFVLSIVLLFIGFLIALWDGEKRGLHDRIARTVVIEIG